MRTTARIMVMVGRAFMIVLTRNSRNMKVDTLVAARCRRVRTNFHVAMIQRNRTGMKPREQGKN
ncbi:MAG: hypothetical protein JHD23_08080 [Akkermansiaceae bacterium]|nr:hypothetical protein [Akkermansiaceae bacterium]